MPKTSISPSPAQDDLGNGADLGALVPGRALDDDAHAAAICRRRSGVLVAFADHAGLRTDVRACGSRGRSARRNGRQEDLNRLVHWVG